MVQHDRGKGGTNACLACKIGCKRVRGWNLGYRPLLSTPSLFHPPPLSPSWPMPISSAYIPNNPKTWQQLNIILITISVKIYWKQCHIVTPAYMHVSESYNNWKLSLQKREIFFFHFMLQLHIYHWVLMDYVGDLLLTKQNISFSSWVDNGIKASWACIGICSYKK